MRQNNPEQSGMSKSNLEQSRTIQSKWNHQTELRIKTKNFCIIKPFLFKYFVISNFLPFVTEKLCFFTSALFLEIFQESLLFLVFFASSLYLGEINFYGYFNNHGIIQEKLPHKIWLIHLFAKKNPCDFFSKSLKIVCYIFASLFSMYKREHLWNKEKCFLFHLESSFHFWDNQILTFQIFKCNDVIKCLSMKHETHFIG